MTTDTDKLLELAKAATRGPWTTEYDPTESPCIWITAPKAEFQSLCKFEPCERDPAFGEIIHPQDHADAAFIAEALKMMKENG